MDFPGMNLSEFNETINFWGYKTSLCGDFTWGKVFDYQYKRIGFWEKSKDKYYIHLD